MRMIARADVAPVCFPGTAEIWKASSARIKFSQVSPPLPASSPSVQSSSNTSRIRSPRTKRPAHISASRAFLPLMLDVDSWRDGLLIHSHIASVFFLFMTPVAHFYHLSLKSEQETKTRDVCVKPKGQRQRLSGWLSQSRHGRMQRCTTIVGNRWNINLC